MHFFIFFFFKQKTAYEMLRSLVGSEMCIRDSSSTGLIEDSYVSLVEAVGTSVQQSFGRSVVEANDITGGCAGYESQSGVVAQLTLPMNASFDAVVTVEDIRLGQRIESYRLEIRHGVAGEWIALPDVHGLTVGRKVVDMLPSPIVVTEERSSLRFVCTSGKNQDFKPVTLKSFGAYLTVPLPSV
eukprot:TRINITY_DN39054_c0_g1_i1.p1 TRINITY_DN39054_c0_g1~~TRINITY_DN39054_c0_g1_i1.p1  ORF type:complete len:185 (-),score=56.90 TRINITY_DN39054_c0_g1_i1:298-852(-)